MAVTITQFRRDLFQFADQALNGGQVEFVYRGVAFKVTPEKKKSKIDHLIGQPVVAAGFDIDPNSDQTLLPEMEAEWEKDWAEL